MASQGNPLIKSSSGDLKIKVSDVGAITNGNLKLQGDTAILGVVARVHLKRYNFDDFYTNKGKYLQLNEPKKRGRKRRLPDLALKESDNAGVEVQIKKRGRPKKVSCDDLAEDGPPKEVKRRRRPKVAEQVSELPARPVDSLQQFNGGESTDSGKYSSPRIRKPSSRLQDFIVASDARYYGQPVANNVVKDVAPVKPTVEVKPTVVVTPKPKQELLVKPPPQEKPVVKMDEITGNDSDPLDISNEVDVVRSFLPVFDNTPQPATTYVPSQQSRVSGVQPKPQVNKEKEVQTNKPQSILKKNNTTQQSPVKDKEKLASHAPSSTPKNLTPVSNKSPPKEPKRNLSPGSAAIGGALKKLKLTDAAEAKSVVVEPKNVKAKTPSPKPKVETKINGSNRPVQQKAVGSNPGLFDDVERSSKGKAIGMDFNRLVRSLKLVKLPSSKWKIRIVVSKQQTITEVTFTNKDVHERCVKFSRTFAGYLVSFGKKVVKLLGAPSKMTSLNDVSILLDIVHNISPTDMVVEYCQDDV